MIGRQVIETSKGLTLNELEAFMKEKWNTAEYNSFFVGRPTAASIEEYILLPATERFMVAVFPRKKGGLFSKKDKVVLTVCENYDGIVDSLAASVPSGNVFFGIWKVSKTMSIENERKGPAEEVLQKYTEYMKKLLSDAGLTA